MSNPIVTKIFTNPTGEDLHFTYDSAEYNVKAGESKYFTMPIALHAAKKLAMNNCLTSNPDELKVLANAYLENIEVAIMAKQLGINFDKIRAESMTKEKEKARVLNLESQVNEQNKKIDALIKMVSEKEEKKDKRTKEYKEANKVT